MITDTKSDTWQNVGSGVFYRRYQPWDLSVGAIVGSEGVTVIDTGGSPQEAEQILKDVQEAFELPVVAAINTHATITPSATRSSTSVTLRSTDIGSFRSTMPSTKRRGLHRSDSSRIANPIRTGPM